MLLVCFNPTLGNIWNEYYMYFTFQSEESIIFNPLLFRKFLDKNSFGNSICSIESVLNKWSLQTNPVTVKFVCWGLRAMELANVYQPHWQPAALKNDRRGQTQRAGHCSWCNVPHNSAVMAELRRRVTKLLIHLTPTARACLSSPYHSPLCPYPYNMSECVASVAFCWLFLACIVSRLHTSFPVIKIIFHASLQKL